MATLDIVTADEVAAWLGNPSDVDLMSNWISTVSNLFDQASKCGPVVQRTLTAETHSGGRSYIKLKNRPVASVSSVTEYNLTAAQTLAAESNTSKTANDYYADLDRGYIYRRTSGMDYMFPDGRGNVVVTYVAGRFADTASVSDQFKEAALVTIAFNWKNQQGTPNVTFPDGTTSSVGVPWAIPKAAIDILGDEYRLQVGVG
jgi:hypothetical protein